MDKTTLKSIGVRLRREFSTVELLPFPLQRALAELAAMEAAQRETPPKDEDEDDGVHRDDTHRRPTRRGGDT